LVYYIYFQAPVYTILNIDPCLPTTIIRLLYLKLQSMQVYTQMKDHVER